MTVQARRFVDGKLVGTPEPVEGLGWKPPAAPVADEVVNDEPVRKRMQQVPGWNRQYAATDHLLYLVNANAWSKHCAVLIDGVRTWVDEPQLANLRRVAKAVEQIDRLGRQRRRREVRA